jgi:hypothetical protein
MLAIIEVDYFDPKKMTLEQRNAIRDRLPQMALSDEDAKYMHATREFLADLATDGPFLLSLDLKFSIKRFKGCYIMGEAGTWHSQRRPSNPEQTINIQVAIPNLALFAVDEVMLLDDACTDALNSYLKEGWRILAVCPPASQRRPDYILGRSPETRAAQAK